MISDTSTGATTTTTGIVVLDLMTDLGASRSPLDSSALHANRNFEVLPDQNYGTPQHLHDIADRLIATVNDAPHRNDNMAAVHGSRRYLICRYYVLYMHQILLGQKYGVWSIVVNALIDKGALRASEQNAHNLSRSLTDYEQTFGHPLGDFYRGSLISSNKKYFHCAQCSRPGVDHSDGKEEQSTDRLCLKCTMDQGGKDFRFVIYKCTMMRYY
jgi:hypothetical protein